ncbi:fructosamine kinase family protein [Streptomyces sp. NPDC005374]|uniref:fructosamine kinase family protein n=1 Tax=Streptomyces sp. NPDC005374 TaxID=3364713 RepID=UPI0036C9D438
MNTSVYDDEGPGAAAARFTGRPVTSVRLLSDVFTEVTLDDGRVLMVKRADTAGEARAEAAGLRWLAEAETVRLPTVHGQEARLLVTDLVPRGRPNRDAALDLGRSLAELHATGAPAFGSAPPDGPREAYIGRAPMRNAEGVSWPEWYAEHRVLPYLRRAVDDGTVALAEAEVIERLCDRLPDLSGPAEPPARLHGDLWNGNVLWGADGHAWLIDPAAHGGHRETDLAMLHLFGCPHLDEVLRGYEQVAPLADGRADRIGLHQLFPLLVHAVLFGRGYAEQALSTAKAALER